VLGVSATVCAVALLGGTGILPSVADDGPSVAKDTAGDSSLEAGGASAQLAMDSADDEGAQDQATEKPSKDPQESQSSQSDEGGETSQPNTQVSDSASGNPETDPPVDVSADESLPADSGEGYRVVFSEARQRVWLVGSDNEVDRTYPVSGSLYDNLDPGSFEVYSRSEQAYAFDGSGSMKYFVRFAQGDTGAAIGFHDIPLDNSGDLVQTIDQLGTPQSHGCVRQERDDAIALWEFAPIGTEVVVV
jgi:hypothetical protein